MSMVVETLTEVLASISIGLALSTIAEILFNRKRKKTQEKTSEKIDRLSNVLKKASSEIEALEDEVKNKSIKLQELDDHSKRLETLLSVKEEQVEAIKIELGAMLKETNRTNRKWTILISASLGAMWFILGIVVRGFLGF